MKTLKSLTIFYEKLSTFGKILLFIALLLVIIVFFKSIMPIKEGMTGSSSKEFLFKKGNEVYDDFYVDIYDQLVFNQIKDDYEIGEIINKTSPTTQSIILDIGSYTAQFGNFKHGASHIA